MLKQFVQEQELLEDSYRLGVKVYESGFRPDFIVGVWRGGSAVGMYVQECLQYLGIAADHIAIRTSYRGMDEYLSRVHDPRSIRAHGLKYLYEAANHADKLLIIDDVYSTGQNVNAVINRLTMKMKRNLPHDIRVAVVYYKPSRNQTPRAPDYYLYQTDNWLVLPYELTGLTPKELSDHKPWIVPILAECGADRKKAETD